jgi:hypothetical protein
MQDPNSQIIQTLGRIEGRVEDLHHELKGNGQPGFIAKTNDRLVALEGEDRRRAMLERWISGGIAALVSGALYLFKTWFHR